MLKNVLFLFLIFGGGLAWFVSSFYYLKMSSSDMITEPVSYFDVFKTVESDYAGWILNIFRNTYHPLEPNYHCFFFLTVWGILKKNNLMIFAGQALACFSGVFVGIEISAILMTFLLVEFIIRKEKNDLKKLFFSITIFTVFILYYNVFLPQYPIARILVEQHKENLHKIIQPRDYFNAYGILLLTVPLVLLNRDFRKRFFSAAEGRLLFIWLIVVVLLIQNDKILTDKRSLQPAHFARGYLFTALLMITLLGIYPWLKNIASKYYKRTIIILSAGVIVFSADNIVHFITNFMYPPHPYFLIIPAETKDTIEYLASLPEKENIYCSDLRLGDQIPSFTHHSSVYGIGYATPSNSDKERMGRDFLHNVNVEEFIKKYSVTMLVIPKLDILDFRKNVARKDWKIIYENKVWEVYKLSAK